ncbi:MAG: hypothetical protein E4G96_03060 [Chrysiogenales bacterium]|nr:MAG: hypothetical protein E4G96_03060 [Chrysiogenales bacterium]
MKKITINELACDVGIVIFSMVISRSYDHIAAVKPFSVPFPVIHYLFALYFLPVIIGTIYNHDFPDKTDPLRRLVMFTLVTNTVFIFIYLLYFTIQKSGLGDSMAMTLGIIAVLFLLMGPIAGLMFTGTQSVTSEISPRILVAMITFGMVPLFIVIANGAELFGYDGGVLQFGVLLLVVIGDVLLILFLTLLLISFQSLLKRLNIYEITGRLFRQSMPFFAAFILVVFNISSTRLIFETIGRGGAHAWLYILAALIFSGVLPLRIILAVKPPYSVYNILIGIVSVSVLVLSIFR